MAVAGTLGTKQVTCGVPGQGRPGQDLVSDAGVGVARARRVSGAGSREAAPDKLGDLGSRWNCLWGEAWTSGLGLLGQRAPG